MSTSWLAAAGFHRQGAKVASITSLTVDRPSDPQYSAKTQRRTVSLVIDGLTHLARVSADTKHNDEKSRPGLSSRSRKRNEETGKEEEEEKKENWRQQQPASVLLRQRPATDCNGAASHLLAHLLRNHLGGGTNASNTCTASDLSQRIVRRPEKKILEKNVEIHRDSVIPSLTFTLYHCASPSPIYPWEDVQMLAFPSETSRRL